MRRDLLKKPVLFFIGILAAGVFSVWWYDAGGPFKTPGPAAPVAHPLFRKMGVLPLPAGTGPVDFTLDDLSGKPLRISDLKGTVVFLNFWATWCPDCRREMPSMQKLQERLAQQRFSMVTVNLSESAGRVTDYFNHNGLTFVGLLDTDREVSRKFGIRAIPTTILLDTDGSVIGSVVGSRQWDSRDALALFEHLLSRRERLSPEKS